jgi:DNA polymerase-3 subunit gamma/tau
MTLYLKYRPQKISELDLVSVRTTLQKIIASGDIPHGFLFSGPRGTGKTSSARILAKVVNCKDPKNGEPCNECEQCKTITSGTNIDVIEMDAASNRGIDDVRILRENVKLAPVAAKKKIYIIDEAHMLTTEASNALLKTLEEPPSHVIFILATTNAEKLPITIHSRLTPVNFTKASILEITKKLESIAKGEKYKFEPEALASIARYADGSFRDAVKTLEQLAGKLDKLDVEQVNEELFQGNILQIDKLLEALQKRDKRMALEEVERVVSGGGSIKVYMDQLIEIVHMSVLAKCGVKTQDQLKGLSNNEVLALLEELIEARGKLSQAVPQHIYLEIALSKWCGEEKKTEDRVVTSHPAAAGETLEPDVWNQILTTMRAKNASIEALLRAARPVSFDGKTLTLGVYYKFHKERLEIGTNRRTLEEVVTHVYGNPIHITCLLTERSPQPKANETVLTEPTDSDILKAAKEIFSS